MAGHGSGVANYGRRAGQARGQGNRVSAGLRAGSYLSAECRRPGGSVSAGGLAPTSAGARCSLVLELVRVDLISLVGVRLGCGALSGGGVGDDLLHV